MIATDCTALPFTCSGDCQGIVVLAALNHLEELLPDASSATWGSDHVLHAQIEALRLAFFDALQFNADPTTTEVPVESLVDKEEAAKLRVTHKLSRQVTYLQHSSYSVAVVNRLRV